VFCDSARNVTDTRVIAIDHNGLRTLTALLH
jgi:hypothetical protein